MKSILSIQSHVVYGYVGNKAAVYPLQYMGYDVWPINTVQFSNHTGYGKWQGEIFAAERVKNLVQGIFDIGQENNCQAILSGYMGSREICEAVAAIVQRFKALNPNVLYLCDPVMGGKSCFVKPEVLEFFKEHLVADIITPNQYEAGMLTGQEITDTASLKKGAKYFHDERKIKIVVITGLNLTDLPGQLSVFVSDGEKQYLLRTKEYKFPIPVNGTGDLFSSLYLGHYLNTRDIGSALQLTMCHLEQALQNTYESNNRELQVLSVRYDTPSRATLPMLISV